jgi:hypothetical protein
MRMPQAFLTASNKGLSKAKPKYNHVHASRAEALDDALSTKLIATPVTEATQTLDLEKDKSSVIQLDYETWLPFCAKEYHISPKIEDYILVNTLICPSDIPNRNGIGFPATELARWQPPPVSRMAYKAWKGCPVHLEHDNEDCRKAYGVILDASLHKVTGYGGGKLWKVMGLLAIDKNKYPDIAQKVLTKQINTYSMGAMVDAFTCSYCGTECSDKRVCSHIRSTKDVNWRAVKDYDGSHHLAFLNAHGLSPIECSIVADPAWAPALSDEVWDPWAGSGGLKPAPHAVQVEGPDVTQLQRPGVRNPFSGY